MHNYYGQLFIHTNKELAVFVMDYMATSYTFHLQILIISETNVGIGMQHIQAHNFSKFMGLSLKI